VDRTQVAIVGAGPAGLTLALLLERAGIEAVVLEARSREYVERRVRAGLLEPNTVELFDRLDVAERLRREGLVHDGINLRRRGRTIHVPMSELTGRHLTVYGQQEVVKDLIAAWLERGGTLHFEAGDVAVDGVEGDTPRISYSLGGAASEIACDFVAGCDGFHGVCRPSIPAGMLTEHEHVYPFCWLGILAEAAPTTDELVYAWHDRGFALYSMRSPSISRLYLQVGAQASLDDWPDERIWDELQVRLGSEGWRVGEGPIFEKGITPMRSFVCDPMRHGRLFLAGDAAHIVPPTGAKGLNLAVNDVRLLAAALVDYYASGSMTRLDAYSDAALRRVWRAQDFSDYMTRLLHDLGQGPFQRQLQLARLEYLERSEAAARSLAENYVGLPATPDF
jgi:p-hydroxybenzoate 3-monooxygenase